MADYDEALERQVELFEFWQRPESRAKLADVLASLDESPGWVNATLTMCLHPLYGGETFYCSPSIVDIVSTVAETLPGAWRFEKSIFPTPAGFIWLAKSVPTPSGSMIRAITWVPAGVEDDVVVIKLPEFGTGKLPDFDRIALTFFLESGGVRFAVPLTAVLMRIGTSLASSEGMRGDGGVLHNKEAALFKIRFFAALLAFMEQRLFITSSSKISRAARRRLKQRTDKDAVRVILLRRVARSSHAHEQENIDWSCRWVVRGHWRNQWYPSLHYNKPLWITPYIKGPEDKPLKRTEANLFAVVH